MKQIHTGQPDIVARGSDEGDLRRIARTLHQAGIRFEVEEGMGGSPENPHWQWAVIVDAERLDAARRVLSAEPEPPATQAEIGPGALFESHAPELLRLLLALAAFGLAGGIWFRSCV